MDNQNSGLLSYQLFSRVMGDLRIGVSEKEVVDMYKEFEVAEKDSLNYDRFIKALQGTMSQNKFCVIQQVFDSFNKDRNM